jgi:hypothetical protein
MHLGYWWESQKERDRYEDKDVGGWTILKCNLGWDGMDLIDVTQDRNHWRAVLMNTEMNLRVP